jgi:hypothetical protein
VNILKAVVLAILLAGGAFAQVGSSASGPPDVTVVAISWRSVKRNPKIDAAPPISNPGSTARVAVNQARINEANDARTNNPGTPAPPVLLDIPSAPTAPPNLRQWFNFIYEFTVKNTGSKIIRKLVWEHSFTDPTTQQVVRRREYKSSTKIRPGKTAKLVVHSNLGPIGTINANQAGQTSPDLSPEQMVIKRVEYTDGSVWVRN